MDFGTVANVASVVGFVASIGIAAYQHRQATIARRDAEEERQRAANLESHLMRQRWQQLRSIAEQIDIIEQTGRHIHFASEARIHARLKEQFASLLGVMATSTPSFSAATVRHWVQVGRLNRPWQIREAVSHIEVSGAQGSSDDANILSALCSEAVPPPTSIEAPKEPNAYVAAYILLGQRFRAELKEIVSRGGQSEHSAALLMGFLAADALENAAHERSHGRPTFRCWGADSGKKFRERFEYYQSLDFWVVVEAAQKFQAKISEWRYLFEPGRDLIPKMLIPTVDAVETAHSLFPHLVDAVAKTCPS